MPAIHTFEKLTKCAVDVKTRRAAGGGRPVVAVKITVGTRYVDRDHEMYARHERAERQQRKDRKEFDAKLTAALQFDDAFLRAARTRHAENMHGEPWAKLIAQLRAEAVGDWTVRYFRDRQAARDFAFDGQLEKVLMAKINSALASYRADEAERRREDLEREAKELAAENHPDRVALREWEAEWDRKENEQDEKDILRGHPKYQMSLFENYEIHRRKREIPSIFDIDSPLHSGLF